MLTATDLIRIPYTPGLTEAGIAYACRSLAYTYNRMGGSPTDRLRRIVAGVAVELAFRRYLGEQAVPFDVLGATPFTDPDRYDVSLGGHRCDVKSFFVSRRAQVRLLRQDPGLVLQAPALVPLDQFAATRESHKPDDLYLFAFLLGVTAASRADTEKAAAAGQPVYFIHPMPASWARPSNWVPLDGLALKSEGEISVPTELGGMDAERNFTTVTLELPPKTRLPVEQNFYSLAYAHVGRRPEARIGLHSPVRGEPYLIPPHEWGNIWVYGMDILLTGWLTHEEFRRKAKLLKAGAPTFQYDRTRTKNLFVTNAELNPLRPLFEQVKQWKSKARL